jgi:hypothetical protein
VVWADIGGIDLFSKLIFEQIPQKTILVSVHGFWQKSFFMYYIKNQLNFYL